MNLDLFKNICPVCYPIVLMINERALLPSAALNMNLTIPQNLSCPNSILLTVNTRLFNS